MFLYDIQFLEDECYGNHVLLDFSFEVLLKKTSFVSRLKSILPSI